MYKQIIKDRRVNALGFFCAIFGTIHVSAQVAPPKEYPGIVTVNYIRNWAAKAPETDPALLKTKSVRDVIQTSAYFDGLGRPLQTIIRQGSLETLSGTLADMVSPVVYDEMGREQFQYLPFVANNTANNNSITDGNFKLNPFQQQATFYSDPNGVLKTQGELWFYSQINFEASPLNRLQEGFAPGNSWVGSSVQGSEGNRNSVKIKHYYNTAIDDVKKWNVTDVTNNWGNYSVTGAFTANELFKEVTVDEHGKQVIEFKDKEAKLILKKVQLTATADDGSGSGHPGWLCTYYLYDVLNNLRCVIQPKGVVLLPGTGWSITTTILDEFCFRYEYDDRGRMIIKKVPGAGEVWMVYDTRNRLVLTQDANLRTGSTPKWMYTLYDNLNRPIETGLWDNSQDRLYHKGQASGSSAYPDLSGQTYEQLLITGYDTYATMPGASGLSSSFDNSFSTNFSSSYNTSPNYPQQQTQATQTKGMITWTQTKVLGSTLWLYTVSIYDDKGRAIQVKQKNHTGGTDILTTQYGWSGQPLVTVSRTENAVNTQVMVVVTQMTYDDLGRVTTIEKKQSNTQYNSNAMSAYAIIATREYDALGQLKKKKIGSKKDPLTTYPYTYYSPRQPLEELNYEYNIRGWMLGMNRDYVKETSSTNWFGFDLGYDKHGTWGTFTPQYNGNISGTIWKSKGDGEKRKYDFFYDASNRFLKANFNQYVSGTGTAAVFDKSAGIDFTSQIGDGSNPLLAYDANGNILAMKQWGLKLTSSPVIDEFAYEYKNSGSSNKLLAVTESTSINTADNKLGDFTDLNRTLDDYDYDVNGNLIYDKNKNIASITYNHLNLPSVITVTNKGNIVYTYDARGSKLKKVTTETNATVPFNGTNYTTSIITTTTYLGSIFYESKSYGNGTLNTALGYGDKLQFASHEEGRIRTLYNNIASLNTITGFEYDYFIKDHLGNVRMVLTEEVQKNFYPAATLEGIYSDGSTAVGYEKIFYTIDQTRIVGNSEATGIENSPYQNNNGITNPYPNGNSGYSNVSNNSQKLYKLTATGSAGVTGLGITLKVMSGDKIDIHGKSYYFQNASGSNNVPLPVNDIINGLFDAPGSTAGSKVAASDVIGQTSLTTPVTNFLNDGNRGGGTVPKAYINYILFDENFKFVAGNFSRVGSNSAVKNHYNDGQMQNIPVAKNGYLYVYVSNESPVNVFFDNLQVVHTRSPLIEETHYYPFGSTLAGVSSKSLNFGNPESKHKFNGAELNKDFNLNQYEFLYRNYDPQIGRWHGLDPRPSEMSSLYSAMGNNPILYSDILGDTARGVNETSAQRALDAAKGTFNGIEGGEAVASLLCLDEDGVTFANIDKDAFDKAYDQLTSDDAKALAMEYYKMINSDKTQFIAMLKNGEKLDLTQAKHLDAKTMADANAVGMKQGTFDPSLGGGGITSYTKSTGQGITQVSMDYKTRLRISVHNGSYKLPKQIGMLASVSFKLTHELAHALMAQGQTGSFLPNYNANVLTALQVNGIYLRAHGFQNFYDISSHWRLTSFTSATPFTRWEVTQIPSILKRKP